MKWTDDDINYLTENYPDTDIKELMDKLGRKRKAINSKASRLGICKSDKYLSTIRWTDSDINYLINNYQDKSNNELSLYMNRSETSIALKALSIGLYKSKEYISKITSNRNKELGRNLSLANLREIAKFFKTKAIFRLNDYSAYITAIKLGCLDDICSHMIEQKYSTPQLICKHIFDIILNENCEYNTRKVIKPYELDLYYPKYKLAIEYNGKYWHKENDNTELKIKMCDELDIKLIIINERTRKYDSDIKEDIINLLPELNKFIGEKINIKEIVDIKVDNSIYDGILDDDYLLQLSDKYNSLSEFKNSERKLYNKLNRLNQLHRLGFCDKNQTIT